MNISESKYAQCLYFTSAALARKVEKMATEVWKSVDLPPSHGYLLMSVLSQPGIQPSALAAELHLQPSTITRLIEKLESKKLVIRTTEGKITNVYPTPKGKQLLPKMNNCIEVFSKKYAELLGGKECGQFVRDIAKFTDKIAT